MAERRSLSREEIERAIALREDKGWSVGRIARETGCSESALDYHFLKHGVEPPKSSRVSPIPTKPVVVRRGDHVVRRFTADEDAELLKLEARGLSLKEIDRRLGRRHNSIRGRLMTLARRAERLEAG